MLALQWNAYGFHAAVLCYSVAPAVYPTALLELGKAVLMIKEHAKEWDINPDQVILEGSSAGGHLAAMVWHLRMKERWGRTVTASSRSANLG